jgi:hypothetical protein
MKFIDNEGQVQDGILLTNEQATQRERLITYFHEEACGGSYHASYDHGQKKCVKLANDFITGAIAKAANTEPIPEPEIEQPVALAPEKADIPF